MNIIHCDINVGYLPLPNTVETCITRDLAPADLTRTSFALPMFDDGSFLFAVNQRRGLEVAGGHIEPGEDAAMAAIREALEETGAVLGKLAPVGYLRMKSEGIVPADWAYPHPLSYQQFFAARVMQTMPYVVNSECAEPVRINDLSDRRVKPSVALMCEAARSILG